MELIKQFGKKKVLFYLLGIMSLFSAECHSQDTNTDTTGVPLTKVLYNIDKHLLGSITYNYGLNFIVAGLGTYGIVKSGFDWKWRQNSVEEPAIPNAGMPSVVIGGVAPFIVPIAFYAGGLFYDDRDMKITGLALGQAAVLGVVISSSIKAFSGRVSPQIKNNLTDNKTDFSQDFNFGFLRRGIYSGWPSSHTTVAFAMGTTLMELYPDNFWIKAGSLTFATFIGLGISTNIHWFSDFFAGALIGYAIGSTVGSDFRNLMNRTSEVKHSSFYITPGGVGFEYKF